MDNTKRKATKHTPVGKDVSRDTLCGIPQDEPIVKKKTDDHIVITCIEPR